MAIDRHSNHNLLIENVAGAPPPEVSPNEESIDLQRPDLICTPDPTKPKVHRQVVGVENA